MSKLVPRTRTARRIIRSGFFFGALCCAASFGDFPAKADVGRFKTNPVYYRLIVELELEKAPFTIDIVVACEQHRTQSRFYGGTNETLGMSAYVFAVRVPGDHAIKVRTTGAPGAPKPCSGDTTANGRVPKDWLPLIIWYDKADELAHGLGYADQDAYAGALAKIGFRRARVETASAHDFERFMHTGPKNLVPAFMAGSLCCSQIPSLGQGGTISDEYLAHPEKAWSFTGPPRCRGVRRVKLSDPQREKARAFWPKERPDRWQPAPEVEYELLLSVLQKTPQRDRAETYDPDRQALGQVSDDTVFPVFTNEALQGLERDPSRAEAYAHDALVDETPSLRGFLYCDSDAPPDLVEALLKRPWNRFGFEGRRKCRLGGMDVRVKTTGCNDSWIVFERDDYALFSYQETGG